MTEPATPPPGMSWPGLAAGPATSASMGALVEVVAGALSGAELVDAVVCAEKAMSLLVGVQARLLAALAVPFVAGDPMRLAAKLARRSGLSDDDETVLALVPEAAQSLAAGEVAAALRVAPVTAGARVRDAIDLTTEFTPARQALEDGRLDRGKLRALVDQIQVLPADRIGPVLDQVLPETVDRCTSEIREIAAQAVITADPAGAADRHRQAADRRELTLSPGTDAMATLKAFLPATGAVKIFQVSDLLATGTAGVPGDGRGIGARRVDALIDLADRLLSDGHIDLTGYLGQPLPNPTHPTYRPRRAGHTTPRRTDPPAGTEVTDAATVSDPADTDPTSTEAFGDPAHHPATADPSGTVSSPDPADTDPSTRETTTGAAHRPVLTRQGRRPHLTITLSLDTLAGLDDLPATLAGYGSIPADLARSIAASAGTITAALTDPTTGSITASGELTYRPRQSLRDHAATRTDTCQFPSCRQPAWRCDLDHRDPFDHQHPDRGGPTSTGNTGALCRRHHLFKDHADWQLTVDTSRLTINWTSPTGHSYIRRPRQTAPPAAWIRTTATATAQRLDDIAATHAFHTSGSGTNTNADPATGNTTNGGAGTSADTFEDRLTDAVLRHALANPRRIEYDPTRADDPISPDQPTADNDGADPTVDSDEPPF